MKYKKTEFDSYAGVQVNIVTTVNDIDFISFPADVGNPSYDAFLIQAGLTNEEVHALPADEWIEL